MGNVNKGASAVILLFPSGEVLVVTVTRREWPLSRTRAKDAESTVSFHGYVRGSSSVVLQRTGSEILRYLQELTDFHFSPDCEAEKR